MIPPTLRKSLGPALICLVLGLLVTLQMKTQDKVALTLRDTRVSEDMVAQLLSVTRERDRLRTELFRFQAEATEHATVGRLQEELALELASAGVREVKGPGIVVVLADLSSSSARQVSPIDVLLVLNELRAGGAEAIAINGKRVTDRLWVVRNRTGQGAALHINGLNASGPVSITAVGDPGTLTASLQMRGGVVSYLTPWLKVDVRSEAALAIPAAPEPVYSFSRPGG